MEGSVLKEKFRKLQSTQDAINATANYLIDNSADAKRIIKAWNEEFTTSSVGRKLTLLYLANDVLQRSKSNAFLSGFVHYLPRATAHLYKHGDTKIRSALMRLVEVWTERKVLKSQGMAAVRSHLEKVKDTPPVEEGKEEDAVQGNKRKRGAHPIEECLEEVEEAARQRKEMEKATAQMIQDKKISELTKEEVLRLSALSDQHCAVVKSEIQVRKKLVDLLRSTLTQQEEGLQESKEMLRLCFVRQEEIKKATAPTEALVAQETFDGRGSVTLSEEHNEVALMPPEVPSSTLNIPSLTSRDYDTSAMTYPTSLLPSYVGPLAYGSHPSGQPVHAVTFSVMHPDGSVKKSQEHGVASLYHQAPPFMRQGYLQDAQGPPLAPYEAGMIHEMHSPYGPQLNYRGYPGHYASEKDWRT